MILGRESDRLGQSLLSLGHITPELLAAALKRQGDVPGIKISRVLIELGVPEQTVTEALARQAGIEWVSLADRVIPPDVGLRIPAEYARKVRVVPFEIRDGTLLIAVNDPHDPAKVGLVSQFLNIPVQLVMIPDSDMDIVLDRLCGKRGSGQQAVLYERRKVGKVEPVPIVGGLGAEKKDEPSPEDPAAVRVLDELLTRAVRRVYPASPRLVRDYWLFFSLAQAGPWRQSVDDVPRLGLSQSIASANTRP